MRNLITIDPLQCSGCGECVDRCPNKALQMVQGHSQLLDPILCDGQGRCLSSCPVGAAMIQRMDVADFDPAITKWRIKQLLAFPSTLLVSL